MDIEEDIKILEKFKNNEMQRDKLERDSRCGGWKIGDIYKKIELNIAINHILAEREEDKKKIEELEDENRVQSHQIMEVFDRGYIHKDKIKDEYIPKQKVKDEIETLRKMFKATTEEKLQEYTVKEIIIKVNTLQELLEEGK